MFPFHLWNSHTLLDGHEIWYVITRHLKLGIGVNLIHFSSVFNLIWFFEVDPCLLTFWFSLTAFHLSKWDEIWHAYHAVGCDWSWFIWWFLEMFKIAFELSLAVDFYELLNAMFWPNLLMKWWWWLIWMWTQLVLFLECLNMILDTCFLLFWLFHSLLTLGLP